MAFVRKDRVRETALTTGTGTITLAGARGGYRTFASVMSNGDTCWYAIVLPGSAWEVGLGTYSAGTLARTSVYDSSNGGAAVNFTAGTKDVFMGLPSKNAPFESGTAMVFQQTAAPVGWTKQTTHNNKALRVVSGTASFGGTSSFSSTLNATLTVSNTTITLLKSPAHAHAWSGTIGGTGGGGNPALSSINPATGTTATDSQGGDQAHNHTLALDIQYVDLIIATKD